LTTDLRLAVIWLGDTKFIVQSGFFKVVELHDISMERGVLEEMPEPKVTWQLDFIGFVGDKLLDIYENNFLHIDYRNNLDQVESVCLPRVTLKHINIEVNEHEPHHYQFSGTHTNATEDDDE